MKRHGADVGVFPLQWLLWLALLSGGLLATVSARAEDGYDLWLRYQPLANAAQLRDNASELVIIGDSPTLHAARDELARGLQGLLGNTPPHVDAVTRDGAIVLGAASAPQITALKLDTRQLGREGYLIRSANGDGHRITLIVGGSDIGVLYGTFYLLRLLQTGKSLAALDVRASPRLQLRMLNHWDNLDGLVERGYAGASLWNWQTLPGYLDPRYTDYARANASLGINGTVLNNVNAKAWSLTPHYLDKSRSAGDGFFRPYGVGVFLSARFSAPIEIGGLKNFRPAGPAGAALVARHSRRHLCAHSGFWRVSGQGQRRRPARPAGLWTQPRRWREPARRCTGAAWRGGDVARVRRLA